MAKHRIYNFLAKRPNYKVLQNASVMSRYIGRATRWRGQA